MSRSRQASGPTPTTPLRRISRGSLNALSHSASKQLAAGSTPLSFLQGAMSDLAEEAGVLKLNLESIEAVHDSLHSFNENFAMYMYGLKMNAYCVEWPEAPLADNFERAEKRIAQQAQQYAAQHDLDLALSAQGYAGGAGETVNSAADQTYVTTDDESIYRTDAAPIVTANAPAAKPALKSALKKPATATAAAKKPAAPAAAAAAGAKPKMTLAQKKKRQAYTDEIIETLPLEYRGGGNDPKQNAMAKHVCMALIAAGAKGLRIADIVKNPEMSQAKINKTLIALVAAKHVVKASNNVRFASAASAASAASVAPACSVVTLLTPFSLHLLLFSALDRASCTVWIRAAIRRFPRRALRGSCICIVFWFRVSCWPCLLFPA
jgi:DASH complex subunit DAM1